MKKLIVLAAILLIAGRTGNAEDITGYDADRESNHNAFNLGVKPVGTPAQITGTNSQSFVITSTTKYLQVEVNYVSDTAILDVGTWNAKQIAEQVRNQLQSVGAYAKMYRDNDDKEKVRIFTLGNSDVLRILAHISGAETIIGLTVATYYPATLPSVIAFQAEGETFQTNAKLVAGSVLDSITQKVTVKVEAADTIPIQGNVRVDSVTEKVTVKVEAGDTVPIQGNVRINSITEVVSVKTSAGDTVLVILMGWDAAAGVYRAIRVDSEGFPIGNTSVQYAYQAPVDIQGVQRALPVYLTGSDSTIEMWQDASGNLSMRVASGTFTLAGFSEEVQATIGNTVGNPVITATSETNQLGTAPAYESTDFTATGSDTASGIVIKAEVTCWGSSAESITFNFNGGDSITLYGGDAPFPYDLRRTPVTNLSAHIIRYGLTVGQHRVNIFFQKEQ